MIKRPDLGLRVLLVHANPFQRVFPVPAYGLERLRTAAAGTGAQIEILDPFLIAEDPVACVAEAAARLDPDVVGLGIRIIEDCIPIDRLDAPDDEPVDVAWFPPQVRDLREAVRRSAPRATLVLGGAGFSSCPQEFLSYLDVDLGIVGAGEDAFRALLERLDAGESLEGVPGLVHRGRDATIAAYALAGGGVTGRDPLYASSTGFPVRTRIGCAMQCVYCTAANLGRRHSDMDVALALDEVAATVEEARIRGIAPVALFFADDEFNLPDERHPLAVLRGIRDRGLARRLTWRAYFNPTPFSDRLAAAIAATNGHASITVDSAADAVLKRSWKPFRRRHLDALVSRVAEHRVSTDLGLIFGLPGETEETIAETAAFIRSLPASIKVSYAAGARVYPHTPLSRIAAEEPEHLVGAGDPTFFSPVLYSTPFRPRELARRLEAEFADLGHVQRMGAGYHRAATSLSRAYRVVLGHAGAAEWPAILDEAQAGVDGTLPAEALAPIMQAAVWHSRYDLAAQACRRLLAVDLPPAMKRRRLRALRMLYRTMASLERRGIRPEVAAGSG
ncbi:MAG: radical SAM protein [Nitriliruptorales bacterium]|nr:radical SAM protein [Nitriliruptorales bacterium]